MNPTPAPSLRSDRVRAAILMIPKAGMSAEEFRSYWLKTHSKLFSSIAIVKQNLTKYEQFHFDHKYTAAVTSMIPGYTPLPYTGMAIFEAESWEKLFAVFQDEEYLRIVVPDEENFMSRKDVQILGGPFATVIGA